MAYRRSVRVTESFSVLALVAVFILYLLCIFCHWKMLCGYKDHHFLFTPAGLVDWICVPFIKLLRKAQTHF